MRIRDELAIRARQVRPWPLAVRVLQEGLGRAIPLLPQAAGTAAEALVRDLSRGTMRIFPAPKVEERPEWKRILGERSFEEVERRRDAAKSGSFSLLGVKFGFGPSGPLWHVDPVTGYEWRRGSYFKSINYLGATPGTDVKRVWELARLQWLLPCAQAYALDGRTEDRSFVLDILRAFRAENPPCRGVNWASTLEPALRLLTLVHIRDLLTDPAARDGDTAELDEMIAEHWLFVLGFIEYGAIRGNHYFGDLVATVVGAAALAHAPIARTLLGVTTRLLEHEIDLQFAADGVQGEASISYHRFMVELAFVGLLGAERSGTTTTAIAKQRLAQAASYALAYTRPDGSVPLLGDSDDARATPAIGGEASDHRYLVDLTSALAGESMQRFDAGTAAVLWYLGASAVRRSTATGARGSAAFKQSGYFVLRNSHRDHIFIDAATVGLAGRGGHGHNDCLSFEVMLDGEWLLAEGGCSGYSSDPARRLKERGTALHNTPIVNGLEQNDLLGLWFVRERTHPKFLNWTDTVEASELVVAHDGYVDRAGVLVERTFCLEHRAHRVRVADVFTSDGHTAADVEEGFVLAPGVRVTQSGPCTFVVERNAHRFAFTVSSSAGTPQARLEDVEIGLCYGTRARASRLVCKHSHAGPRSTFDLRIEPR